MSATCDLNIRPDYDQVLQDIADYVLNYRVESAEALETARPGCYLRRRSTPFSTRIFAEISSTEKCVELM